jgi:hypothetical protein
MEQWGESVKWKGKLPTYTSMNRGKLHGYLPELYLQILV